jgi:hypothetical protein
VTDDRIVKDARGADDGTRPGLPPDRTFPGPHLAADQGARQRPALPRPAPSVQARRPQSIETGSRIRPPPRQFRGRATSGAVAGEARIGVEGRMPARPDRRTSVGSRRRPSGGRDGADVDLARPGGRADRGVGVILRKEVIQPQVPLRLPCYDLVPITGFIFGACL